MMRIFSVGLLLVFSLLLMSANACDKGKNKESDVLLKENQLDTICKTDADCSVTKADCCGCMQGGKQIAIHKNDEKSWQKKLSTDCSDKVCIQMISNDPSCKMKPACQNGRCELK